ncbi:hypothetical protein FIU87_10470 [Bacillus sp. THAF10]|uniref:hypothetical protein n=1 Tax=Bacillus sp. THAF10 TaxID=2587848 RepID=UPI0012686DD6|nr:hypothetical protein [Bacillus sp. THAF10]QFT89070.1 hypothetical protein FIU87_10470 [Bacillus sp. THAF10]
MRYLKLTIFICLILSLFGCALFEKGEAVEDPTPVENGHTDEEEEQEEIKADEFALSVATLLRDKDFSTLSEVVHPVKGVRFTPYAYIREESDQTFTGEQIKTIWQDQTVYTWGEFDGSGDPINLTFQDYYEKFVYDVDFAQPEEVSTNKRIGQGNSLDNAQEFYPDAIVIEFHFSGIDPKYEGLDWRSLRVVVEQLDGKWYVVGIIHDQWTI